MALVPLNNKIFDISDFIKYKFLTYRPRVGFSAEPPENPTPFFVWFDLSAEAIRIWDAIAEGWFTLYGPPSTHGNVWIDDDGNQWVDDTFARWIA